jgi:hypothetical protein
MTEVKPAMSTLRRRMIDDMTLRNLSPAKQRSYLHGVTKFSRHFGGAPDRLGLEDVRSFQVTSRDVTHRRAQRRRRDKREHVSASQKIYG